MAICVSVNGSGELVLTDPQPADTGTCAYVMLSGSEAGLSPFALDVDAALAIGASIWLVCAVAWGFRKIGDYLWSNNETE